MSPSAPRIATTGQLIRFIRRAITLITSSVSTHALFEASNVEQSVLCTQVLKMNDPVVKLIVPSVRTDMEKVGLTRQTSRKPCRMLIRLLLASFDHL